MGLNIRFATEADTTACRRFDSTVSPSVIRSKSRSKEVILAFRGEEPIGYLRFEYLWSKIPYIALITVREDSRGRGVGAGMLRFLEAYLRRKGHSRLLSSSQADEPRPQRWHRQMGFEECGMVSGLNEGGVGEVFFGKSLRNRPFPWKGTARSSL